MGPSVLADKSIDFSLRAIKLYKYLLKDKREFIISKQVFRSSTSIGANIHEAYFGQSKADFIAKLGISLRECGETQYWLKILYRGDYINQDEYNSIYSDCEELGKLLTSSIKTAKKNNAK